MRTVLGSRPWKYDSTVIDIPWRQLDIKSRSLVIGVLPEDPDYPLHPPVQRTIQNAAAALERAGHTVIRLPHDPHRTAGLGARIGFQYFTLSGPDPETISQQVGEPLVPSVAREVHPFTGGDFPASPDLEISQRVSDLNEVRDAYSHTWKQTWCDNHLDVVLAPGAAHTAVPHDTYGNPVYTLMWNVLDVSAPISIMNLSNKGSIPPASSPTARHPKPLTPRAKKQQLHLIQTVSVAFF